MSLSEEKGNVEAISCRTLTRRSSFVDESLTGRTQDFTTSASALVSPTLPKKVQFVDNQMPTIETI